MTTRTRSLLDLLLTLLVFALLAGIYLAASHAIESHVKAETIRLRTNQLAATNSHHDEIEAIFEERQRRAIKEIDKEIERLSAGESSALKKAH
jgi:Flp pilus assembly protein TadB